MKKLVLSSVLLSLLYCCKEKELIKYTLPDNAISLIASDTTKVWKLKVKQNKL